MWCKQRKGSLVLAYKKPILQPRKINVETTKSNAKENPRVENTEGKVTKYQWMVMLPILVRLYYRIFFLRTLKKNKSAKSSFIRYHTKKSLTSNSISPPRFLQGVGSCTLQMLFFSRKGNEKIENQSNHLLVTCDDSFKNSPCFAFPARRYKWSCINWRGLCRQAKHPGLNNITGWGRCNIWLVGYPPSLLLVIRRIKRVQRQWT